MDNESVVEQIVRSLSFDVEAVPQDNVVQVTSTSKSTPLNLKIKVRKKNEAIIQHGFISVPKVDHPDSIPDRIRLVSSDQTLMTFDILMEADLTQKPLRKPRKHIFDVFRPGACLGAQRDDDDYSYMPKSEGSNSIRSDGVIKQKAALAKINGNNMSASPNRSFRHKTFFGKCKPGGCLDPPFSEDKYSYKPATLKQIIPVQDISTNKSLDYKNDLRSGKPDDIKIFNKKKKSVDSSSLQKTINKQEIDADSILSLYQAESMRTSTTYSNSIITYPPAVTSSELRVYDDKNRVSSENKFRKSINEVSESYYIPPKKVTNQLTENGEDNRSSRVKKDVSRKEEDTNVQNFQFKTNEILLKNHKSDELNSKKSDSFVKKNDTYKIKEQEFNQFSKRLDFKPEKVVSLANENKTNSSSSINKIEPKYLESSQSEAIKIELSNHLSVASCNLKKENDDKSIIEIHHEKKTKEIYQLQSSEPMDSQHSEYRDDQEKQATEQNEMHKPEMEIEPLCSNAQFIESKTDNSFNIKANKVNLPIEEAKEKIYVNKDYKTLPKDNVNKNKNSDDITNKDEKKIDSNTSCSQSLIDKLSPKIKDSQMLETLDHDNDATPELNQMLNSLSKKLSSNPQNTSREEFIIKEIEDQSLKSGSIIPYPINGETEGVDKNALKNDELNNILDKSAKDEILDVLQNGIENVNNNKKSLSNSESATLISKTTTNDNEDNISAGYVHSKDVNKNYSNNLHILKDPQVLKTGPHLDTENSHFEVSDYKKDDTQTKFDKDITSEMSILNNNLKISNVEENSDNTISDNNIGNLRINKQDEVSSTNSFEVKDLETPYSLKQDSEKFQEDFAGKNNNENSDNRIKPFLHNLKQEDIIEESKSFTKIDERNNSAIGARDTRTYTSGHEVSSSKNTPTVDETSIVLQLPTPNKSILKTDTISVSVDLAFQSYLNNNNERVVKSFNSSKIPERFSKDSITIIKSQIRSSNSKEIMIPIDPDNDLSIQIKKSTLVSQRASNLKHDKTEKRINLVTEANDDRQKLDTKYKNHCDFKKNTTNEVILRDNVMKMYEEELIPLQIIIKELKEEIDTLTQKIIFNAKLRCLKTISTMRLIKVNKKCGCLRTQL